MKYKCERGRKVEKIIAYTRVSKPVREALESQFEVSYFENYEYIEDENFKKALEEAVGIIGLELKVTKELLDLAPNLRVVSNVSVGYDNLDVSEMTRRNIMATNTPGVLTDTVADAVLGMLLASARRIPELDKFVKEGKWKEYLQIDQFGTDVHHKKVGIIGMGSIGQAIAKRCFLGFDMKLLYYNRSRKPEIEERYNAVFCDLNKLLKESDFVVLMVPGSKETERFMSAENFKKMKKSAIFINASRGKNVDENALYKVLMNKEILAAALDVFETEPVNRSNPLLSLENVVTLPHIGAATRENELSMSTLAKENLVAALKGDRPPNLINHRVIKNENNI